MGRVPGCEILVVTPLIKKFIEENKLSQIPAAIADGSFYGMQSFNQSLVSLYQRQMITYEEALNASTNPEEFKLNVRGIYSGKDASMAEYIGKEEEEKEKEEEKIEKQISERKLAHSGILRGGSQF